ncbi:hypothetical protein CcCBS67573_g02716 [Chytriomyces confervae]|uniref:Vta1/callose synthase N-terminal domain-containing protein n=1 Tax=Chytriomyces confervae TaxID=246404 RepID=A0A507FHZ4_9FUNG|nr:hypothetical protein HDU80_007722 [Chytriomyces hyalinus]TPX76029.1 hypothetical protein CcCBS67573_g02716 [Chytriomyces confervae]
MSSTNVPEPLKGLVSFLQRAEELVTRDPIVSYYCYFYAAKQAIELNAKDNDSQMFMLALLDKLEAQKAAMGHNEALSNDVVGYAHVENFALKIFTSADNEDRAGKASKKTARSFIAASTFLEVLKVFGPIDDAVSEKIKYGRFKAVDIIKALKEGRQPVAGPPGGEEQQPEEFFPPAESSNQPELGAGSSFFQPDLPAADPFFVPPSATPSAPPPIPTFDLFPSIPSSLPALDPSPAPTVTSPYTPSQPAPPRNIDPTVPYNYTQPAPLSHAPPVHSIPQPIPASTSAYVSNPAAPLDHTIVTAATKNCKFAISALQYDDVNTAIENLEKALTLLRPYKT